MFRYLVINCKDQTCGKPNVLKEILRDEDAVVHPSLVGSLVCPYCGAEFVGFADDLYVLESNRQARTQEQ